ncbi:PrgI family protein [Candidatus Peregrinibacteria bacterium]|nr:PrgI family protein [Candidatus Peregrinibacteria bacterium]
MQFKVPQNVQREDKIVGPLTLKQLIICGIGFAVAYGIYVSLAKYYIWVTWILPVGIVAIVTMAFAFARPLDLSFSKFIMRWIEFTVQPRKRFWILGSGDFYPLPMSAAQSASKIEKRAEKKAEAMMDKRKKLEEITKILNTHTPQEDKITK